MLAALALLAALIVVPAPGVSTPASSDPLSGTWDGLYEPPGTVGSQPFALRLELAASGAVEGQLVTSEATYELDGSFDGATSRVQLEGTAMFGLALELDLALEGERLSGWGHAGERKLPIEAARASHELLPRVLAPEPFTVERERPATTSLVGLDDEAGLRVDERLRAFAREHTVIGMGVALVVDAQVVDVRSLGWEDYENDVPATGDTQYRWASISKPMTAVTALLMADDGELDLEADVRDLVSEYPEKSGVVTPRLILCHQSGVTHYTNAVRTWREYDVPFPFEDRLNALDIFESSPLLFEPGSAYSYSTHAYSLLGAALQRAGGKRFHLLVGERVLAPAGMKNTFPDFRSRDIPHRSQGYGAGPEGAFNSGDDDVSWKLPGGGWTSSVGDLGRFAAALIGDELLSVDQKELLWTEQRTADGSATGVGLGFFLGTQGGRPLVHHGGAQRKTRTFMAILPGERLGVALMCNTEGTPIRELAPDLMRLLLE